MNWTGGTLQRTKHANKGVVQKQKTHFARARTQLQQSLGTLAAPFRPDYLQDNNDCETGQCHPPFGSRSVRHTGHSARKRYETTRGHRAPSVQIARRLADQGSSQKTSSHFSQGRCAGGDDIERQHERKRKNADADADAETKLLEANKKRLLRQQDWVGVAALRPVNMQFRSIKEKNSIGKRRQLDKESKGQTRRHSPTTFLFRNNQDGPAGQDETLMSGALPVLTTADNIRIRIGSDALTTAASAQPNKYARSQTNSDSMLFDEEGEDSAQRIESESPRGIIPTNHIHTVNPRSSDHQSDTSDRSYSSHQNPYAHHNLTTHPDYRAADLYAVGQSVPKSEAISPSYQLTHHVRGVEHPLKVIFGRRSSSIVSRTASATYQICEPSHGHADFDVEGTETGCASRDVGKASQLGVRRQPNSRTIHDEEPWWPYLDTGTSSSCHVGVDEGPGTSVPKPPHGHTQNTRADCTSWPQIAADGDLTQVNLSKVSTSLPAVTRRSGVVPVARSLRPANAAGEFTNHEALWQAYILGSDPQSAIETIHTPNETSEDSMSRATKGYASTRQPVSNTVTTVGSTPLQSTPFKSLSGQASRISDDVQYSPQVGSRPITSAAPYGMWGYVQSPSEVDVQGDDQDEDESARSRFGEQSTHASMQNHVSRDSAMFSDTRMSCSDLDQRGSAWDDVSRRGQASGSTIWQRGRGSSTWDDPSTDEAGIDLVDVDKLT